MNRFLSPLPRPDRLWGPPSVLSNEFRGAFSKALKRLKREAGHSLPFIIEVQNAWSSNSTASCCVAQALWQLMSSTYLYTVKWLIMV